MADCNNLSKYTKKYLKKYPEEISGVVACLAKRIDGAIEGMEKATQSAGDFVSEIGKSDDLFKSILGTLKNSYSEIAKFTTNLSGQYRLGEEIAKSYKKLSVNIGIGYQNQRLIGDEFTRSLIKVKELGGDIDDVNAIYTKFSDQSGRVRILDDEEVQRIFAIEKATGLMGDSAAALAERFDLVGISSEDFADNIEQVMKDAQKIGLNSSKVVKVLSDNFENMQRMSFRGGVKAMTEMSKLAVKMRMEISDMLGMADKFYEPEAAIEAAAQLQLMGGDIAQAFGDPFETMYLARNKPEELAKRLQTMTENMASFNSETGEFEITAEARQQLSFAAEQLGLAKDNVIDMAFQANKMKDIKLSVGGDFTEEQLDKITSIAKFKDGQWKVDVEGDSIAVDDITTDQLEKALVAPTDEKNAILETAKASMVTNELISSLLESQKANVVLQTKIYENVEKSMGKSIDSVGKFNNKIIDTFGESLKESPIGETVSNSIDGISIAVNKFSKTIDSTTMIVDKFRNSIKYIFSNSGNNSTGDEDIYEDATISPKMSLGNKVASFDSGDEFLVGKSGGPLSGYLAEMNEKLNKTITTPTIPLVNTTQKIDVGGTVNFGNITISMDGNSENITFSKEEKEKISGEIKKRIIAGITGMMDADKRSGKDAYFGT